MPYSTAVIQEYRGQAVEKEYSEALKTATVARGGQLQGTHTWLEIPLDEWRWSTPKLEGSLRKKKVLMLGSRMVAGPAVQELGKRSDVELVVSQCPSLFVLYHRTYCIILYIIFFTQHDY